MHKTAITTLALLLVGCGPSFMWVKSGATQQEFDQDMARCQYEAASSTASYSYAPTSYGMAGSISSGFAEGFEVGMRKNELINLCMRAKGYSQQAINR